MPIQGLPVALATTAETKAPRQEHALDGDVHHARALAQHARQRTEHDRDRALNGALQDARQAHRLPGRHPHQEREDERGGDDGRA